MYHRFNLKNRIFHKTNKEERNLKWSFSFPNNIQQDFDKFSKRYHLIRFFANESPETPQIVPQNTPFSEPNRQAAASCLSATSQRFGDHIGADTESRQERHYATIGKNKETTAWFHRMIDLTSHVNIELNR